MPKITGPQHDWSPRQTLLARCPRCSNFVNWRHDRENPGDMDGSCCDLIFKVVYNGQPKTEFSVFLDRADMHNVYELYPGFGDDDGGEVG